MWETSGGWSEGWTEHKKLANDMMIRMEGDVYQEQSLSKGWPEWTDGGGGHILLRVSGKWNLRGGAMLPSSGEH